MEAKFFAEIEKKISVKTIKEFEREVRTKINDEFDSLRKKNTDLSRILMIDERNSWSRIKNGEYSWLNLDPKKTKKLFRLIDLYTSFSEIFDDIKNLDTKITRVLELKEAPEEE